MAWDKTELEALTKHPDSLVRDLALALKAAWCEIDRRGACAHIHSLRERRDGKLVEVCCKCSGARSVVED